MRARLTLAGAAALLGGLGCLTISDPNRFVFEYRLAVYACDTLGCDTPDTVIVTSAARGDTVFVRHELTLIETRGGEATAVVRAACAQHVVVRESGTPVQTLPDPLECPDSTEIEIFDLGVTLVRLHQWVLDSSLAPGVTHAVTGLLMVQPRLEPTVAFLVQ